MEGIKESDTINQIIEEIIVTPDVEVAAATDCKFLVKVEVEEIDSDLDELNESSTNNDVITNPDAQNPPAASNNSNFNDNEKVIIKYKKRKLNQINLKCTKCDRNFKTSANLIKHKCQICQFCGTKFKSKGHLSSHVTSQHGAADEKPIFECDLCRKRLASLQSLQRHVNEVHLAGEKVTCGECGKTFCREEGLNTHILNVHAVTSSGELPNYVCQHCDKKFGHRESLRYHMRIHSGNGAFLCEECGRVFSQKCHLKEHSLTHKMDAGESKPHVCPICGKNFARKQSLNDHVVAHTGDQQYRCDTCDKTFSKRGNFQRHLQTHINGLARHFMVT